MTKNGTTGVDDGFLPAYRKKDKELLTYRGGISLSPSSSVHQHTIRNPHKAALTMARRQELLNMYQMYSAVPGATSYLVPLN